MPFARRNIRRPLDPALLKELQSKSQKELISELGLPVGMAIKISKATETTKFSRDTINHIKSMMRMSATLARMRMIEPLMRTQRAAESVNLLVHTMADIIDKHRYLLTWHNRRLELAANQEIRDLLAAAKALRVANKALHTLAKQYPQYSGEWFKDTHFLQETTSMEDANVRTSV